MIDYYKILEIEKDASKDDIKKQYRRLARKYHPDVNKDNKEAEEKFKKISEAYETLSDSNKRKSYDMNGQEFNGGFNGGFRPDMGNGGPFSEFFDFESIRVRMRQQTERSQSHNLLNIPVHINHNDLFFGCEKEVGYWRDILCKTCHGKGCESEADMATCSHCGGSGKLQSKNIVFTITEVCPTCRGRGRVISKSCSGCKGSGASKEELKIKVTIPKGIPSNTGMRIKEGGNQRIDGKFDDCIFRVIISSDGFYFLNNNETQIKMPVPLHYAIIGGEIEVPTMHGMKKHKIPTGCGLEYNFLMKGLGFPIFQTDKYGDQHVFCTFEIPKEVPNNIIEKIKEIEINERTYPEYIKVINKFN